MVELEEALELQALSAGRVAIGKLKGPMLSDALAEVEELPDEAFDFYDTPFERKHTLRDKRDLPLSIAALVHMLELATSTTTRLFELRSPLLMDKERHYCGVFRYQPGAHLGVHVDAGIHPPTGLRKMVTALLYLGDGGAALNFWLGDDCTEPEPAVRQLAERIDPQHGTLVFFENSDQAWHSVSVQLEEQPRTVITVSYLSADIEAFQNMRQRAYFVPEPGETWTPETYELRDLRADAEHYAEAYRT